MELLVIRHARAGTVKEFAKSGKEDDLRPLTADGVERMRLGARGLRRLVGKVDMLATSPLVRARETAEIVRRELDEPALTELEELRPGHAAWEFVEWLQGAAPKERVAIVGHDMHLSRLVGLLLSGRAVPLVKIKKGAAVLLEVRGHRRSHGGWRSGRLLWSLTPRQLRMLGGDVPRATSA